MKLVCNLKNKIIEEKMQNKSITSYAATLFAHFMIVTFNVHAEDKNKESTSQVEHEMSHVEAIHQEHGMPSSATTRNEVKKEAFYNAHDLT
jgi:hypothetical protein